MNNLALKVKEAIEENEGVDQPFGRWVADDCSISASPTPPTSATDLHHKSLDNRTIVENLSILRIYRCSLVIS